MSGGVPARACVCRYFLSSNLNSGERVTYLLPGGITPTSGAAAQRKEGRDYLGICPPCLRPDIWFSSDKGLVGREAGPSLPHILFLSPSPLHLPLFASLPGFFSAPPPFLTYYVAQAILKLSILVPQSPQSCGTVYPHAQFTLPVCRFSFLIETPSIQLLSLPRTRGFPRPS